MLQVTIIKPEGPVQQQHEINIENHTLPEYNKMADEQIMLVGGVSVD